MSLERPTAVIADDEDALRGYLRESLRSAWPELHILAEAENGPEALEAIERLRPEVAFLDIRMPGMSGLDVARNCTAPTSVVFMTAYEAHAVEAFEREAVDYLLKPLERSKLERTVARLKRRLEELGRQDAGSRISEVLARLDSALQPRQPLTWIKAGVGNEIRLVPVSDVIAFISQDKYTTAITPAQEWVIRSSLKELEAELDPRTFWRVHRNAIVRVEAIGRVLRDEDGGELLEMKGYGKRISVSRRYSHLFKQD